jgi:ER-derived vesicles protein
MNPYASASSSPLDRTSSLPSRHSSHGSISSNPFEPRDTRRASIPTAPAPEYRRSSIPAHLQRGHGSGHGYSPSQGGHTRRGSVLDIAADFLGPSGSENLEQIRRTSGKVEDAIDGWTRPVRPYLPGLGRFLIVVTFLEDALRILTQMAGEYELAGPLRAGVES